MAVIDVRGQEKGITMETVIASLKQIAAQNGVFATVLEPDPEKCSSNLDIRKLQYLAVFAETGFPKGTSGNIEIMDILRKATDTPAEKIYCRCRVMRLYPYEQADIQPFKDTFDKQNKLIGDTDVNNSGSVELLDIYAEACRIIRETGAIRDLFRAEGWPVPGYLPEKTVQALCHMKEKLSDDTLPLEVRKRYGQCLRRLVQEAHMEDVVGERTGS